MIGAVVHACAYDRADDRGDDVPKIGCRHITEIHCDLCRQGEFFAKAAKHVAEYRDDVNQQNRSDQHGHADYADWVNHGAFYL